MQFLDIYKKLDNLCKDILRTEKGVSEYLEVMRGMNEGSLYVDGWSKDYSTLRNYRHMRNKIVHDIGTTEENSTREEDALWLENFYSRLLNGTDPISLYKKARKSKKLRKVGKELQRYKAGKKYRKEQSIGTFVIIVIAVLALWLILMPLLMKL